jgi:hypothetical protein
VKARRLDDPEVIGGLSRKDLELLQENLNRILLWGDKNYNTLLEINKLSSSKVPVVNK